MSTQTESKQREVSELLTLGSYQDMTDAEIESVINYKTRLGTLNAQTLSAAEANIMAMESIIGNSQNSAPLRATSVQPTPPSAIIVTAGDINPGTAGTASTPTLNATTAGTITSPRIVTPTTIIY